jgi:hypothetical protein
VLWDVYSNNPDVDFLGYETGELKQACGDLLPHLVDDTRDAVAVVHIHLQIHDALALPDLNSNACPGLLGSICEGTAERAAHSALAQTPDTFDLLGSQAMEATTSSPMIVSPTKPCSLFCSSTMFRPPYGFLSVLPLDQQRKEGLGLALFIPGMRRAQLLHPRISTHQTQYASGKP